jgi:hypothetical protein
MTEQLHRLIDGGAPQPVINERISGLMEVQKDKVNDHEKRIRFLERTVSYALGAAGLIGTILYAVSVFKK